MRELSKVCLLTICSAKSSGHRGLDLRENYKILGFSTNGNFLSTQEFLSQVWSIPQRVPWNTWKQRKMKAFIYIITVFDELIVFMGKHAENHFLTELSDNRHYSWWLIQHRTCHTLSAVIMHMILLPVKYLWKSFRIFPQHQPFYTECVVFYDS
jgi:hypothetical protein